MRVHELLNLRIRVPLLAIYLVSTDVEELVGEKFGHLADEDIEKLVGTLASGIHGGVEDSPLAFNRIRPWGAGEVGIADKPGCAVTRHIEFRNYANAAVTRVVDHVADLVLGVVQAVRTQFVQLGKALAFDTEALIVGKVPVKNVQLDRGHSVEIALDHVEWHEMAAGVDHQTAPRKARLVLNRDCGNGEALRRDLDELQESLQPAHDAEGRGRAQFSAG